MPWVKYSTHLTEGSHQEQTRRAGGKRLFFTCSKGGGLGWLGLRLNVKHVGAVPESVRPSPSEIRRVGSSHAPSLLSLGSFSSFRPSGWSGRWQTCFTFCQNLVGLEEGGRSPQGEDRRGTGRGPLWKSGSFWNHTCMILHGGFATYFCIGPRALSRLKSVKRQRLLPFPSFGLWKGQCLRACDVLAGRQESAVDR